MDARTARVGRISADSDVPTRFYLVVSIREIPSHRNIYTDGIREDSSGGMESRRNRVGFHPTRIYIRMESAGIAAARWNLAGTGQTGINNFYEHGFA
jgi:hypothetical protein